MSPQPGGKVHTRETERNERFSRYLKIKVLYWHCVTVPLCLDFVFSISLPEFVFVVMVPDLIASFCSAVLH